MLFPISHERMTARRWPIVTTAIVLLCLIVHPFFSSVNEQQEVVVAAAARKAAAYWAAHPYLQRPPVLERALVSVRVSANGAVGDESDVTRPDDETVQTEQEALDELCTKLEQAFDDAPLYRWGYVPAANNVAGLFTGMFLHGGWLHLMGNMWFLFLCGMNLEDRWGRLVYGGFYIAAGVVAALTHKLAEPTSVVPLIGVSGAVAGAMGAFLVLFAKTKVRMVLLLARAFIFNAPAWVMLLLWIGVELLLGAVGRGDGTAHWAHVGGFAFGVAGALVLRKTGVDKKLDLAVERVATVGDDGRIETARMLVNKGRAAEAVSLLGGLSIEQPESTVVHLELLRAAQAANDTPREEAAYAKLIELYLRADEAGEARALAREMEARGRRVPALVKARLS